ncbi:hypothetical protein CHUAL_000707 [Chamberlinius hualienensis]
MDSLNLLDLPYEMLLNIVTYLSGADVVQFSNVCQTFKEITYKQRYFNLSKLWNIKSADLYNYLKMNPDSVTYLNINHCYWLSEDDILAVGKLNNLKELHMMCCSNQKLFEYQLVPTGLDAMSINWDSRYFMYTRIDSERRSYWGMAFDETYFKSVFISLKSLTLYDKESEDFDLTKICHYILNFCTNLDSLKFCGITCALGQHHEQNPLYVPENLLPKLTTFRMEYFEGRAEGKYWRQFLSELKNLKYTDFSVLTAALYEYLDANPIFDSNAEARPLVSVRDITEVHLNEDWEHNCSQPLPLFWLNDCTPKCSLVKMKNLERHNFFEIVNLIVANDLPLKLLTIHNCAFPSSELLKGLDVIAENYDDLRNLELIVNDFIANKEVDVNRILNVGAKFTHLRKLDLSANLLRSFSNSDQDLLSKFGNLMTSEITDESMRNSPLWEITENCKGIEDFRIYNAEFDDLSVVCESTLACISKWEYLISLYMVSLDTNGGGKFLKRIIQNCTKLELLHITNSKFYGKEDDCSFKFLLDALPFASKLKDISYIDPNNVPVPHMDLLVSLQQCRDLECIYFSPSSMSSEKMEQLETFLASLQFKKLGLYGKFAEPQDDNGVPSSGATNVSPKLGLVKGNFDYNYLRLLRYEFENH